MTAADGARGAASFLGAQLRFQQADEALALFAYRGIARSLCRLHR